MNKRDRKTLIYLISVILITGIAAFLFIENEVSSTLKSWDMQGSTYKERHRIYNEILDCLDFGICKEGLTAIINGETFIINKETCLKYNRQWREDLNACYMRREQQ